MSEGSRFETVTELARLIRDRRQYLLIPLFIAIVFVLIFVTVAEMPILIPFFYAVF